MPVGPTPQAHPAIGDHPDVARSADKLLKDSGVRFWTHRWKSLPSFDELLAKQGTHRGVKTLAVDTPGGLLVVALRAEDEIDYGKLAEALGVDRDPITPAASIRLEQILGVEPGFETIVTDADVTRFVDQRVISLERAVISSGRSDRVFELAPSDLVSVSGATVADLAAEQPS
jgi:prolyl-tRNA editing enzyme YbaK/EbsC (Cys-tRNA(Pro) deacylase)